MQVLLQQQHQSNQYTITDYQLLKLQDKLKLQELYKGLNLKISKAGINLGIKVTTAHPSITKLI